MQVQSEERQSPNDAQGVPWLQLALIGFSIIGATLSLILADIHAQNQLGLLPSAQFCGPEDACNSLAVSRFSRFIGIPVAVWGFALYAGLLVLSAAVRSGLYHSRRLLSFILRLSVLALIINGALGAIMLREESLCFLCVATYGVNLVLALCALLERRKHADSVTQPSPYENSLILTTAAIMTLILLFGFSLNRYLGAAQREQVKSYLAQLRKPTTLQLPPGQVLGPKDARFEMVIFHDYHCAHCARLRRKARILRRYFPEKLSLRFVNVPFDSQCNSESTRETGACAIAEAALVAESHERLDDFLRLSQEHKVRKGGLKTVMAALNLDSSEGKAGPIQERLKAGIKVAREHKIRRLPTFFINGYRFEGVPSIEGFSMIFEHLEKRGSKLRGRAKASPGNPK